VLGSELGLELGMELGFELGSCDLLGRLDGFEIGFLEGIELGFWAGLRGPNFYWVCLRGRSSDCVK
jgi:hypothetical protein